MHLIAPVPLCDMLFSALSTLDKFWVHPIVEQSIPQLMFHVRCAWGFNQWPICPNFESVLLHIYTPIFIRSYVMSRWSHGRNFFAYRIPCGLTEKFGHLAQVIRREILEDVDGIRSTVSFFQLPPFYRPWPSCPPQVHPWSPQLISLMHRLVTCHCHNYWGPGCFVDTQA